MKSDSVAWRTPYVFRNASTRTALVTALIAGVMAAALRWYFVTRAQVLQPLYVESGWGDAAEYYRYAWNLYHHGLFSSDVPGIATPKSDSFRDPAYPVFLSLLMAITDNYERWYALVLLTQAVLGGLTVSCAILAIRDALPTWLLLLAGVLMAVWPHLVAIPAYVLSENLTALLFSLTALALAEASRRQSASLAVAGGVTLAIAALCNSVLAPVFLPLACVFAWKRTLPRRHLFLFMASVATPLLAWGIRNATIEGPFSSSFRAEVNLVQGSWPTYHIASQLAARHDPVGIETIDAINLEVAAVHFDRVKGLRVMADRMSQAPGKYLAWYLSKPALTWGWEIGLGAGDIYVYPTRNSPFMTNPAMKAVEAVTFVFNGVLALLALAGTAVIIRRSQPSAAMLTFAIIGVWITLVYWVLQSDARYSIPYRTGEVALALLAVARAVAYMRAKADRPLSA